MFINAVHRCHNALAASRRPFLVFGAPGRALVYFLIVNSSILVAWIRFLRGERIVVWEPSRR
jgi:hypothetical protein